MVLHTLKIKVQPKDRANAVRTIRAMVGPTMAKSGCQYCSLYSHVDNDDELMLLEIWDAQESLDKHIRSQQYDLILETMELGIEEPSLSIYKISSSLGLNYVKKVKMGQ